MFAGLTREQMKPWLHCQQGPQFQLLLSLNKPLSVCAVSSLIKHLEQDPISQFLSTVMSIKIL